MSGCIQLVFCFFFSVTEIEHLSNLSSIVYKVNGFCSSSIVAILVLL